MKRILSSLLLFTIFVGITSAQCFNMTDLHDPSITCTYGYYSNPYANTGVVNGRHTVNIDPTSSK